MALSDAAKHNFQLLLVAAKNGELALVECTDKKTGETVPALCAVVNAHDEYIITPLAKQFLGDPYEELDPPAGATAELPH